MARREDEHAELAIPSGWYAVCWSKDLIDGAVEPIHYFGEDLVVFRTRAGQARVLDAYCPHLGAHLGHGGRVIGESIRCPFHGWRYDGDSGHCLEIPYCDQIPKNARVRPWEVREKNGLVFVWYHPQGKPSYWELPDLEEVGHPDWTEPRTFELEVPTHVQDMHENNNDPVHFQFVHGMMEPLPSEISYSEDGRIYTIISYSERETPLGTFKTKLVRDSFGVGMSTVRSEGIPDAGLLLFSSTSPIEPQRTVSRWLLTVTKNLVDVIGEEFQVQLMEGVQEDMKIWKNKVHRAKPLLCKEDRFLGEYRQWVKQFYV